MGDFHTTAHAQEKLGYKWKDTRQKIIRKDLPSCNEIKQKIRVPVSAGFCSKKSSPQADAGPCEGTAGPFKCAGHLEMVVAST